MLRAGGYARLITARGEVKWDTFTCVHCGALVDVPPGKHATDPDIGGGCWVCMDAKNPLKGLICVRCVAKGTCRPLEKWLDNYERQAERARAVSGYFVCS